MTGPAEPPSGDTLRKLHAARARSAYERAAAACQHAGVTPDAAQTVPTTPVGRAANALRLSARSLTTLDGAEADPAAAARCARNAAATAALAAGIAGALDDSPAATTALRAALTASQAAAAAAGGRAAGQDPALNAAADGAEEHATETARAAGWTRR
ncbi:hypothetical protein [Streptomyces arenae]|uniref:hypothetical protein n=1 Tax=Streptomyces arenae TaxID=29301 RepID=UPI002659559A|nr:hypothetical protein [Streptomyces arenae]MCG7204255.1 hypothetical protein [Streptomyces arenae]